MPRKDQNKLFTTIGIKKDTRTRLKSFGKKGELYDDIITRLMDFYEENFESVKSTRRGMRK